MLLSHECRKLARERDPDIEHLGVRGNVPVRVEPRETPPKGRPGHHQWLSKNAKRAVNRRTDFEVDPGFAPGLTEVLKVSKSDIIVRIRIQWASGVGSPAVILESFSKWPEVLIEMSRHTPLH
jgi:hypothetical protein